MSILPRLGSWVGDHKKITAGLLGVGVALIPERYVDVERRRELVELVIAFLVGQGLADIGKERAKAEQGGWPSDGVPMSERRTPRSIPIVRGP